MAVSETCERNEQATGLMSLALDGLLDTERQGRLQSHLKTCPTCQVEWRAMKQVSTLLEQADMVGPPLGFSVRVERRLAEKTRKRKSVFGGVAVLTSSLSLAGLTVASVVLAVLGLLAWTRSDSLLTVEQGGIAVSQVASGVGLVGKGASLFLKDVLWSYGLPVILVIGVSVIVLLGIWAWLVGKQARNHHRNGYV
ncbi:anti-sigma factor family protein [Chloroflexota bacterium]